MSKCPKCGNEETLKLVSGYYVCENGHQWKDVDLTIFEQIYQSKTPEEFAELFIEQNDFGLWNCVIFPGTWCDKKNATAAVLGYFKRKLGV